MAIDLAHEVRVEADAATVYGALSTQKGLASFWTSRAVADGAVGSTARFSFPDAPAPMEFRIDELSPGRRVIWTSVGEFPPPWKGSHVTWDLRPTDDGRGTTVLFRHRDWPVDLPAEAVANINYTWGQVVGRLKAFVESGHPQPFFP